MDDSKDDGAAFRTASAYLEKFERYECQELLGYALTHWLLSTEDFNLPVEPPQGIISNMQPISGMTFAFLFPHQEDVPALDMREVHQIVRELTLGIFGLNQVPKIHLEANFDQSSTVQLPPAYQDTRVGQILTNVDYTMKTMWHGSYFPKDKRVKFAEKWRNNLDVNAAGKPETKKALINEFIGAGKLQFIPNFIYWVRATYCAQNFKKRLCFCF